MRLGQEPRHKPPRHRPQRLGPGLLRDRPQVRRRQPPHRPWLLGNSRETPQTLFGFLDHSSGILQVNSIPRSIVDIIKGVTVLAVVIVNEALKRWHNLRIQQASAAMISAIEVEAALA